MSAVPDRLSAALSDRYRLERELGQGGMATVYRPKTSTAFGGLSRNPP